VEGGNVVVGSVVGRVKDRSVDAITASFTDSSHHKGGVELSIVSDEVNGGVDARALM